VDVDWRALARTWPRRALAFARSAEPRPALSRRAVAADIAVAVVATGLSLYAVARVSLGQGLVGGIRIWPFKGFPPGGPAKFLTSPVSGVPWQGLVAAVAATAPLAARRWLPLSTFWVVLAAAMFGHHYATFVTFCAVAFAAYSAVVHSRFRGPALLSLPLAAVMVMAAFPNTAPPIPARATPLALLIPIEIVGNAVHVWRRRAGDSQARLHRLQAEHEAATRRALDLERARIAGELHDVVTHNVSVMVVQAGAARQVLAGSPDQAREALLAVESSGRAAMTELRYLLGLLCPPGAPADGAAALRPQPGLGQLRPLIDRVAAAGLPVELRVKGTPRGLPAGLDLAAYRVVQEALTNVLKHAGHARTEVRLGYSDDALVVEVADDGRPGTDGAGRASGPGSPDGPDGPAGAARPDGDAADRGGPGRDPLSRGLLGLTERTALYGGDFDAGRRPGGGWLVRARFPVDWPPVAAPGAGPTATGPPAAVSPA
jgi:signal transduction histidine kinase